MIASDSVSIDWDPPAKSLANGYAYIYIVSIKSLKCVFYFYGTMQNHNFFISKEVHTIHEQTILDRLTYVHECQGNSSFITTGRPLQYL